MSLHRDERGVYTVELLGILPLFLMVALLAFQLAMVGGAMNMAENAARTGSRMAGMGGDGHAAAMSAVDPDVRDRTSVSGGGETITVAIDVPVVIPFIDLDVTTIRRSATLPRTTTGGF
ncbi:TadE/TadG family type IV pilus assembly protein [Euzebya sp.]|uniref:TadE/TadG family type IV pilus assembly protein n=1 Tax=Euzebya sp. TaxID=1971409 RepID=UPI0035192DBC